jgi:hypothetical protein
MESCDPVMAAAPGQVHGAGRGGDEGHVDPGAQKLRRLVLQEDAVAQQTTAGGGHQGQGGDTGDVISTTSGDQGAGERPDEGRAIVEPEWNLKRSFEIHRSPPYLGDPTTAAAGSYPVRSAGALVW